MPNLPDHNPDLAGECQHAAEAWSALLGCIDKGEPISPALREAAETAMQRMLAVARNLRAARLNGDHDATYSHLGEDSPQPPPLPREKPPRRWKTSLGRLGSMYSLIAGALFPVLTIKEIWGPVWPSSIVIEAGEPSVLPEFTIPFTAKNPSLLFAIKNANIKCEFDVVTLSGRYMIEGAFFSHAFLEGTLLPEQERPFQCEVASVLKANNWDMGSVTSATISIKATYRHYWLWLWFWTRTTTVGPYTWDANFSPPRWVKGDPLN